MQRKLDVNKLDDALIDKLKAHQDILSTLNKWIMSPDSTLLPKLIEASEKLIDLDPRVLPSKIYRGVGLRNGYQDTLSITKNNARVGCEIKYTPTRPISFTTNLDIANAFGNVVVEADTKQLAQRYLWISDELSYLVSRMRNIAPMTQDEVIIFPTKIPVDLTIISVKSKILFW